jgi:HSP20 family protein
MALLRFSSDLGPVSNLLTLQTELERFLRNPAIRLGVSGPGDFPPVNIFDDGDGIVVMAEIPGMDLASLNVSGQSHTLTIKGERKRETVGDAAGYHRRERPFGQFSRSVQLPDELDLHKAAARYEAGVLTVRVPKAESAKPRQIAVKPA